MTEPKDHIGAYRLVRRLGSGGMGEVFLAWDGRLERPVAAKRMRPDRERGAARRERFRREARAAARLSHPNVVQVFDLVEAGDEAGDWIIMEYVQGRSLADLLREDGPLPLGAAVDLARQIAEGLAAAHAQGLVHRDLKASNVMVTPAGQAKILDFGLARPLESGTGETLTDDGAVLGTWGSMSPEQASGEPADARSDLFSLGVLLYEALTGRPPFLGRTPVETLRNVISALPEPLGSLRPDLPAGLVALVESLLEKDPSRRPADASSVARDLRDLALSPPPGWALQKADPSTAAGEMPTVLEGPLGAGESLLDSRRSWGRLRRPGWIAALAAALVVAVVFGALWTRRSRAAAEPLRVALLSPEVQGNEGEALDFAAFGVLASVRRTLSSLQQVTLVEPSQFRDVQGGILGIARAVSADEALATTVEAGDGEVRVSLRRIRGRDGAMLATEEARGSLAARDALTLARGVAEAVRRAYDGREVREGIPGLEVSAADYAEFLRVRRRTEAGRSAWAPELDRLDRILASSPRFLDAHLQSASLAINLYDDTKDPEYLERARSALRRGRRLAPEMPAMVAAEIRLAAKEGDWAGAEQLLADLERVAPGDPLVLFLRSSLASQRGRLDEAASWMLQAVERQPTWRNLVSLAELEVRAGRLPEARRHLDAALRRVPGNTWVLAKMGELELAYGDLARAESIYRGLVAAGPQRSDLTNLGLVRYLLGRYGQAAEDYRKALELDPGHLTATLNLADAEMALGRRAQAAELHRQVLATLEAKERGASLLPIEKTFQAQCLVYLGESRRGVDAALEALQESPEDADVIYQTALVMALAGERASALSLARKAVALGYQPRWLTVPGFDSLRSDPAFRELVEPRPAARP